MTNTQIIRLVLEFFAIVLVLYCIYREKDIAKWERKVWRGIKMVFKTVFCTVRNKTVNQPSTKIVEFPIKKQVKMPPPEAGKEHQYKNL